MRESSERPRINRKYFRDDREVICNFHCEMLNSNEAKV